jgi:hypothetical protein
MTVTTDANRAPRVSERVALALAAEQAIAGTPGVVATSGPGGRWRTVGSQQVVPGVVAAESGAGCIDVELHLAARWPLERSFEELGEQVRARLWRAAQIAGMAERLGAVAVAFDDVLTDAERV